MAFALAEGGSVRISWILQVDRDPRTQDAGLRAQDDAERGAPEVERAEVDVEVVRRAIVLQVSEGPQVAANSDMIGEVSQNVGSG